MAFEGRSPDFSWIQLDNLTAEPTFPGTATDAYKEGTLFYSNGSGTAPTPKGVYIYTTNDGTATGTFGFQILSPNSNASNLTSGNLAAQFGGVPTGTILPFAKDVSSTGLPTGYLLCDGSAISKTTFATLFNAMGGDGTGTSTGGGQAFGSTGTNFNLPDLRGMFLRGRTGTSTNDPDSSGRTGPVTGQQTGNNVGSYQADALAHHGHYTHNADTSTQAKYSTVTIASGDYAIQGNNKNDDAYFRIEGTSTVPAYAKTAPSTFPTGTYSTAGTDTRPKNLYVDFIIRYL